MVYEIDQFLDAGKLLEAKKLLEGHFKLLAEESNISKALTKLVENGTLSPEGQELLEEMFEFFADPGLEHKLLTRKYHHTVYRMTRWHSRGI